MLARDGSTLNTVEPSEARRTSWKEVSRGRRDFDVDLSFLSSAIVVEEVFHRRSSRLSALPVL